MDGPPFASKMWRISQPSREFWVKLSSPPCGLSRKCQEFANREPHARPWPFPFTDGKISWSRHHESKSFSSSLHNKPWERNYATFVESWAGNPAFNPLFSLSLSLFLLLSLSFLYPFCDIPARTSSRPQTSSDIAMTTFVRPHHHDL